MSPNHPPRNPRPASGPFRADQLRDGDRYELSAGHPLAGRGIPVDEDTRGRVGACRDPGQLDRWLLAAAAAAAQRADSIFGD